MKDFDCPRRRRGDTLLAVQIPPGKPLLDEIRSRGYTLAITLNDDGTTTLTAVHPITGIRHAATAPGDGIEAAQHLLASVRRHVE